jgi:DNA-binding MarR family transcriptional regulator
MPLRTNHSSLEKELSAIGLSSKAAQVYTCVFELGLAFPSRIAEKTHLNRSTVYKILTDLSIKGLVTSLERKGKLCYQVEKPNKLIHFTQTQIALAEGRHERAQKLLPELEGLFALSPHKPRVRFFEGIEGMLQMYEDHITDTGPYEMLSYSNVEALMRFLPSRFIQKYIKAKQTIGIKTRAIFPNTSFSAHYNARMYKGAKRPFLVQSRVVPPETFPYQAEIVIYGKNKVSIINFHEQVLIGVIIEDEIIAGMMNMIFELAWKGAA